MVIMDFNFYLTQIDKINEITEGYKVDNNLEKFIKSIYDLGYEDGYEDGRFDYGSSE